MTADGAHDLELAALRFQLGMWEEAVALDPNDTESLRNLARAFGSLGRTADCLKVDRRLVELLPRDARVRYNLACSCALAGLREEAIETLETACALGFDDLALLRRDVDLDPVRGLAAFRALETRISQARRKPG